ncbi:Wzz/FepE/Etk N-terminal domain-containing protein [Paraglaciecola sp.]|uniref:Wzz/FepE/Etk N-terminal domain-containing protein n=1 Tax=Paraglaciecola sp. TaxID=1920173 RepID=UPI0030F3D243
MKHFIEDTDVLSFSVLFGLFWRWRWILISVTLIGTILSVFYAASQADVYRSTIIAVTPSEKSSGGLSGLSGQLGGLAGLAGISLGGSSDKSLEQIKDLVRSRSFLQDFIERHQLIAEIMAAVGWDRTKNQLIYNPEIYNIDTQEWLRTAPPGKKVTPTSWEAYPVLLAKINLEAQVKKGMFQLSVDHYSPYLAKKWVELLLSDINSFYRQRSQRETQESIAYLRTALEKTEFSEVKSTIYELVEEQIKSDMLSEVRQEFALETLSGAVLPEDKDHPKRVLICILGAIISGIISLLVALIANTIFPLASKEKP